jgi:hypothetical protein
MRQRVGLDLTVRSSDRVGWYTVVQNFGFPLPKRSRRQLLRKFRVQKIYPKLQAFEPKLRVFEPKLLVFGPKLRVFRTETFVLSTRNFVFLKIEVSCLNQSCFLIWFVIFYKLSSYTFVYDRVFLHANLIFM